MKSYKRVKYAVWAGERTKNTIAAGVGMGFREQKVVNENHKVHLSLDILITFFGCSAQIVDIS